MFEVSDLDPKEEIMSVATEIEWDYADGCPGNPGDSDVPPPRRVRALASVPCGTDAATPDGVAPDGVPPARPGVVVPQRRVGRADPADLARVRVLAPPSDVDTPPVRLTRRGVAVVALAVAALAAGLVWLAAASAGDSGSGSAPARAGHAPASVTVRPGDTLWSIAGRVAPDRDPRATVDELARINHLSDAAVVPGQSLRIR